MAAGDYDLSFRDEDVPHDVFFRALERIGITFEGFGGAGKGWVTPMTDGHPRDPVRLPKQHQGFIPGADAHALCERLGIEYLDAYIEMRNLLAPR